jgi:DNA-directed RNA polymerase subunit RPC12/RpoP
MAEQDNFKCLRCGNEYSLPKPEKAVMEERTCPKCRSNSVRKIS